MVNGHGNVKSWEEQSKKRHDYCLFSGSFFHSRLNSYKFRLQCYFYFYHNRPSQTSTPTLSTPNIPSPALFFFPAFIIFQYTILCFYLLCLVLGFSPQNHKPGGESWGVLVTTVLQHLEQCLVVSTHLLTGRMRELKYLRSLRSQARS